MITNQPASNVPPGDVVRSLVRHAKKAIAVFCLVLTATICWIIFAPKEYESVVKVYVRIGRENNTLDPSATTGETVNITQTLESEVNSMLQILESRETVDRVVAAIGADAILANDIADDGSVKQQSKSSSLGIKKWLTDLKERVLPNRFSESREELAMRSLLKRSTFGAPKNSNVLEISCRSGHPELAQKIANCWTSAFITEHLRVTRTGGSLSFFLQQVEENEARLNDVENELREAKSSSGLVSIQGQIAVLEDQAKSIRTRFLANNSLLASSRAKVKEITTIVDALPERVDTDQRTAESGEGWYSLRARLFELQIKEQELKSKYSDQKSEVVAVIEQRKAIEEILEAQNKTSSESVSSPNPTYQFFQQALLNEQASAASLQAERASLEKQKLDNLNEYAVLNENAQRIGDLERKRLSVEKTYLASLASVEQAKILHGLELANISSVSRLQSASYNSQPTGFGRMKTLLLGIFLGVIAGLGIAFVAEYFDRTFVTSRQAENALDVPVLVSIPAGRRQFIDVS